MGLPSTMSASVALICCRNPPVHYIGRSQTKRDSLSLSSSSSLMHHAGGTISHAFPPSRARIATPRSIHTHSSTRAIQMHLCNYRSVHTRVNRECNNNGNTEMTRQFSPLSTFSFIQSGGGASEMGNGKWPSSRPSFTQQIRSAPLSLPERSKYQFLVQ